MKKTLLFATFIVATIALNAQTVWNFSNAPFGASPTVSFASTFTTADGLTVGTDGAVLWTGLSANNKTIDGVSYTVRLQTGGGGAPVAPSKIPTTRYLSFNVNGASTISVGMISSSSSATRTLIIVNEAQTVLDSIINISGSTAATYTYSYTGGATKLYLYSRSSGINYYYVSATNVVVATSVKEIFASKGIVISNSEIRNSNKAALEVYSVTGKRVASSKENISLNGFSKGIYIVREVASGQSLKFTI